MSEDDRKPFWKSYKNPERHESGEREFIQLEKSNLSASVGLLPEKQRQYTFIVL